MADNLDTAHGNNLLDASLGTATFTATSGGLKVALMTANGSGTANGTEVVGGSYARQPVTFAAASSQQTTNNVDVSFGNMPAVPSPGVQGVELWDSAPKRKWQGPLAPAKTTNAGDTVTITAGSLAVSL